MVKREDLIFKTDKYKCNFQSFETIRSFTKYIFDGKVTLCYADEDLSYLLVEIMNFKEKIKQEKARESR